MVMPEEEKKEKVGLVVVVVGGGGRCAKYCHETLARTKIGTIANSLRDRAYLCSIEIWTWPRHCFCPKIVGKSPPTYGHGLFGAGHTNPLD